MHRLWRFLTATVLVLGSLSATAPTATAAGDDILDQLRAVPGLTVVAEQPTSAPYRFFVLSYTQYTDHRRPSAGTFQQRLTLLHKATDRPMVLHTTGYNMPTTVFRSEPMQLVDGNQISVEQRFFTPSIPQPADWSDLDIWQAATDHHELVTALKPIYHGKWISTGASKGGMTSVYHERFYPNDVDGTIAYVAPDDPVNSEDSAYDRFFATVGTPECRTAMHDLQIEALHRRDKLVPKYAAWAKTSIQTFTQLVGDVDHAFEYLVSEAPWAFWQYSKAANCANIPKTTASDDDVLKWFDTVNGFAGYTDQGNQKYVPYYYQAGTQLGYPDVKYPHLAGLLRYQPSTPRTFVPKDIKMRFQPSAMIDVDLWVKLQGKHLMFVYGSDDPWGAEPFKLGPGTRDSFWYKASGANHGANISQLTDAEKTQATSAVQRWAGVTPTARTGAPMAAQHIPGLDDYNPALDRSLTPLR
jgi:PS-10 peptidase S37